MSSTAGFIGEKVVLLMWRGRIKQTVLAAHLGIDQSTLSRKLRGERPWTIDELLETARVLDVPLSDLLPTDETDREIRRYPRATHGHQPNVKVKAA